MQRIVLFFMLSVILSSSAFSAESKKLKILTTIKPISLLVSAIAGSNATIEQLIPDFTSPHDYSFKPSDIRKMKQADIVFRIDEHFEHILSKSLEEYSAPKSIISLAEDNAIHLLSLSGKNGHSHEHKGSEDLHIWTSPINALAMAESIKKTLIKRDKNNQASYQKNFKSFEVALALETKSIKKALAQIKNTPYLVFYNDWHYFSDYFQLSKAHVIITHETSQTGIKSIIDARKNMSKSNISCLFSNPSLSKTQISTLIEGFPIKVRELDILASTSNIKKKAYIQWFSAFGNNVINCLQK